MSLIRPTLIASAISTTLMLAGCGGGSSSSPESSSPPSVATTTTTINGSVVDGPIVGASVCLYANGKEVMDGTNPVCSSTDTNGNYSLSIPSGVVNSPDYLNLIATQNRTVKLASAVCTMQDLMNAAKNNVVSEADLPALRVTNLTSAQFSLVAGADGFVDATEAQGIDKENINDLGAISTLIKKYIDGGGDAADLHGSPDTLSMANDLASVYHGHKAGLEDSESPSTASSTYLNSALPALVTGKTFVLSDSSGTSIVTFGQGPTANTGSITIVGGNPAVVNTGTWLLDTSATPATISISGTQSANGPITIVGLSESHKNGISNILVNINNSLETLQAAIPFTTTDVSGRSIIFRQGPVSFNPDNTGVDHTAACAPNGATISPWAIDGGALIADERASCTGDLLKMYLLERDGNEYKMAWYAMAPTSGQITGNATYGTYRVTTP